MKRTLRGLARKLTGLETCPTCRQRLPAPGDGPEDLEKLTEAELDSRIVGFLSRAPGDLLERALVIRKSHDAQVRPCVQS